jgi:hypothetical protein
MEYDDEELRLQMFNSLMELMEEARLAGDTEKLSNYARLVYETYLSILEDTPDA